LIIKKLSGDEIKTSSSQAKMQLISILFSIIIENNRDKF